MWLNFAVATTLWYTMDQEKEFLDLKGLLCPLPVLKARKKLQSMTTGSILTIEATDPASVIDVPHYCNESGNDLIEQREIDGIFTYSIRKTG